MIFAYSGLFLETPRLLDKFTLVQGKEVEEKPGDGCSTLQRRLPCVLANHDITFLA